MLKPFLRALPLSRFFKHTEGKALPNYKEIQASYAEQLGHSELAALIRSDDWPNPSTFQREVAKAAREREHI